MASPLATLTAITQTAKQQAANFSFLVKGVAALDKTPEFKFKLFGVFELSGTGRLGIVVAAIIAVLITGLFILHVG